MTTTTTTTRRHIEVPAAVRKQIQQELGITEGGLSLALKYQRIGGDSQRAREMALQQGGQVYCTLPECETIHDAQGLMTQVFPNGARLIINKETSEGRIEFQGREVSVHYHVTIAMLAGLQRLAASL